MAGFVLARVVLIEGADGIEKRVELAGERRSADDTDELERTEKRGWGCCMVEGMIGVFIIYVSWRLAQSVYFLGLRMTAPLPIPQSVSNTATSRRRSTSIHPMDSGSSSSSISPIDIQSHLYASLLEGRTADVALRVRGTWQAVYRLHRVVLIQAVSPTVSSVMVRFVNLLLAGLLP